MDYIEVKNFVVKCRAYPNKEQKEKIGRILQGLRVAYNVTAYEMTLGNANVTKPDKKDEAVRWPNFSACMKKEWLDYLRVNHPAVQEVPATSLSSSIYGIFTDLKKSWENFHPVKIPHVQAKTKKGVPKFHKDGTPVWERTEKPMKLPCFKNEQGYKWEPEYYSSKRSRTSFTVQTISTAFVFPENSKSVFISVSGMGKVKVRGWRHDLRFGQDAQNTFSQFYGKKENAKAFGVTVSKDNCGDYWIVVKLQTVWLPDKKSSVKKSIGVDVGVRDIAITSEGVKYKNKHFAKEEKQKKKLINRKLSRRYGWSNIEFREAYKKDKTLTPSNSYNKTKMKLSKLDRKIARRRENYNNNVTHEIVSGASFIGIESLNVKGMMSNHKMAYNLADAAMYDVLSKLKYKSDWRGIKIVEIGKWDPSSQLCHVCGYRNKKVKNLNVEEWTCPECGTHHDRDINAAINIMNFAQAKVLAE